MKNNKGFTLIELLAVIIILGILMIIAIPSVTTYISNSRKSAYIDTAKNIISSARNLVNSGKYEMFNRDVTYYIPVSCLPSENGTRTPYGEFSIAYVVVTYDGEGYNYYFTGNDTSKTGIKNIIMSDKLTEEDIESDVEDTDIKNNVGIGGRSKVISLNNSCNALENEINVGGNLNDDGTITESYTGYAFLYNERGWHSFGTKLDNTKQKIYCPVDQSDSWDYHCALGGYFDNEEECQNYINSYMNVNTSTCEIRDILYDSELQFYEFNRLQYYRPYYLKLYIQNDILTNAWTCVNINQEEYCFKGEDPSEYENNIEILRSIQSHFGNCQFDSNYSHCYNGENVHLSYITISREGGVVAGNSYGAQCYVGDTISCPD